VIGLAFVMNKICAALNYVPVRVAISVNRNYSAILATLQITLYVGGG
jgi:hypothetical protein